MEYNLLGDAYQKNTDIEVRKSIGQYYTPEYIIKYILDNTVGKADIVENPFIKVIDISCGAGYFLTLTYDILKDMFLLNLLELRKKYSEEIYIVNVSNKTKKVKGIDYWKKENIHYHILKHCIYGADKDKGAIKLTKMGLINKDQDDPIEDLNIVECDSLIKWEDDNTNDKDQNHKVELIRFWNRKYDYVVGNPPYIGHKQLNMEYKEWLLQEYRDVFKNKSDISFCFFKRIMDILSENGIVGIITSRYFMESPTGEQLRQYIKDNINILEIVDFYGANIFKGVGVATAIYLFNKDEIKGKEININKLRDDGYKFNDYNDLTQLIKSNLFENFKVKQSILTGDRWILISPDAYNIYKKIEDKAIYSLRDITISFQGIITGCDKAFVLKSNDIEDNKIEADLLKRWIKNSNVERYYIKDSNLSLIYSNLIQDEEDYPNSIDYIKSYRQKLEDRREYKNGIRKWYELQWGRDSLLFDQAKIVFPYKATQNRFAIDYNSSYCSADVYSLIIKDEYKEKISLEFLLGILNSSIYEFYFKLFGKKMGRGMYDYYPNSVLDIKIITEDIIDDIKGKVDQILELVKINKDKGGLQEKISELEGEINNIIGDSLGLVEYEYNIIDNAINKI